MGDVDACSRELVYLGDELRSTSSLIQVGEFVREWKRDGFMSRFSIFTSGGKSRVVGGQGIQYLGENLDRARGHWHRALGHVEGLRSLGADLPLVVELLKQLDDAGLDTVLPRLQQDTVPTKAEQAAVHLGEVSRVVANCSSLVTRTSTRLTLERKRP